MKITMGDIIGKVTKTTMIGAGYLTQGVGIISDKIVKDEKIKNNIHEKTEKISKTLKDSADPISNKVSEVVTKAILKSEEVGGNITKTYTCLIVIYVNTGDIVVSVFSQHTVFHNCARGNNPDNISVNKALTFLRLFCLFADCNLIPFFNQRT